MTQEKNVAIMIITATNCNDYLWADSKRALTTTYIDIWANLTQIKNSWQHA